MKPTQLSQKQLEIINDLNKLVVDGQQLIEEFNAESVTMDEKWEKIAATKRSKRQITIEDY